MNFADYVDERKELVYSTICRYVPLKEKDENAHLIMRDYIDRRGKYRRPGLLLLSGQLFGAKLDDLILPAAAQQISEDWILMQDDVGDDSELRRGKPAIQKIHGWIHSINASNIGHMAMWRMLKDYILKVGPEKGNRVYEKFYDMLAYTVEGQHRENQFIHYTKSMKNADEALYLRICDSKTCYYTVYGPLQIGAIAAGQTGKVLDAMKEIGTNAGVAFQIVDDILDMTGDEKKTGKKSLGDLYEGKLTLMVLHAYRSAKPEEKKRIDAIYAKERKDKTKDEIDFIVEMVNKYDGIGYARKIADEYGEKAKASLEKYRKLLPQNEYTPVMLSAIEELFVRNR